MKFFASIPFLCIVLLFTGCVGEEHTYVEHQELKPGPGLFSGEAGGYIIYGDAPSPTKEDEKKTGDLQK